jgi:hypothetical protein
MVGAPSENAEMLLQDVRNEGYKLVREEPAEDEKK